MLGTSEGRTFRHALLTRFNVRLDDHPPSPFETPRGLDRAWLEHRFDLFERFCLPSVQAQRNADFVWLVYFDQETPDDLKARARAYEQTAPLRPVFTAGAASLEVIAGSLADAGCLDRRFLITSRMDNDDAVAPFFLDELQRAFTGQAFTFVNFTHGLELSGSRVYRRPDPANAFISLIEEVQPDGPRTVFCCQHEDAPRTGPVLQLRTRPAWLQVSHGENLANRPRGIRQPIGALSRDFPSVFAAIDQEERPLELRLDQVRTMSRLVARTVVDPRKRRKLLTVLRRDR